MAHCKKGELADIQTLLEGLRGISQLKEKSFGCFYLKSKGVLHFHKTKERRFAHLWNGKSWEEIDLKPNPALKSQALCLKVIKAKLPLEQSGT